MFGIGSTEFLVIILVAVLVLGPEHLPKVMRTVSKVMSDFRRVSTDFQRTMNLEALELEKQQAEAKPKKKKSIKTAPSGELQETATAETATAPTTSTALQTSRQEDVVAAATAATEAAEASSSAENVQATVTTASLAANTLAPGQEAAPAPEKFAQQTDTDMPAQQETPVIIGAVAETTTPTSPQEKPSPSHAPGINAASLFDLAALAEQQQREALAEAQKKAEATVLQQGQGTPA